jgi:predicted ATPase/DNA-binding SARP family transcriptional activator/Tfp pilus assembly protein PilF
MEGQIVNIPWTIQLFGVLCACSGSERITHFATHKTASLLAYLAYHRQQSHPREVLIELLWPGCEPAAGRNRLNTLLSFLRRLLEPPGTSSGTVLQADHTHVRLHPDLLTTDVVALEGLLRLAAQAPEGEERLSWLEQSIALYREGLLPGFYEEWVLQEQQRWSTRYVEALHELAWNLEQTGALEAALEAVGKVVEVDAYREPSYRLQMRLYAALGQPVAAQQTYQALERLLQEELGVAPSVATRQLAEQIRRDPQALVRGRQTEAPTPRGAGSHGVPSRLATEALTSSAVPAQSKLERVPHLPVTLNRFFGREEQTQQLHDWLTNSDLRLITLTGPGGAGKTRLAVEVARHVAAAFAGRVWFVDLASLQDGRLLPFTLAHTLQVTLSAHSDPLEQVVHKLQEGPSLLLLDNFEHLLRVGASPSKSERAVRGESVLLVRLLLEQVGQLKCLVTSRQPLHLGGEQELSVPVLAVPSSSDTPERLLGYAGVALYVDRAKAVRPEFALTQNNAEAVAGLCHRLEGMPLAIEMAAGWARTLSPGKMLERLERQLELLVSRRRDLPARQQSMRATLEWSYDLLGSDLRVCFARLSVFRGSFSVEAVEAVCGSGSVGYLSELQECSLALGEESGEAVRYRMLESIREYGGEKLTESGERAGVEQLHAAYFLALAEEADSHLTGAEQGIWLERLDAEHDNLRAALAWSLEGPEGRRQKAEGRKQEVPDGQRDADSQELPTAYCLLPSELGLRLCGALQRFWWTRGHLKEGWAWSTAMLEAEGARGRTMAQAKVRIGAGRMAGPLGDYASARAYHEQSLSIYREIGDRSGIANALGNLGDVVYSQGDYVSARTYYEEGLSIYQEIGDRSGIAAALNALGLVAGSQGDYASARTYYEQSLSIYREIGNRQSIATSLQGLGAVAYVQNEYAAARTYNEQSLAIYREIGDQDGIARSQGNLGDVAYSQGDCVSARTYYEECLSIYRGIGNRLSIAASLNALGVVANDQNEYAAARTYHEQSLSIAREIGNRHEIARSQGNLGNVAHSQDDYASARTYFEESLAIYREIGNRHGIAASLMSMGTVARDQGNYASARTYYEQSLSIYREIGNRQSIAESLQGVALLACREACAVLADTTQASETVEVGLRRAVRLWGAAQALREQIGAPLSPTEQAKQDREFAAARDGLREADWDAAWAEGRRMTMEAAVAYALKETLS